MEQYSSLDSISYRCNSSVLTIGTFDGVHIGHQYLIKEMIGIAKAQNTQSVVLTFNPNPYVVLNNESQSSNHIINQSEKHRIFSEIGVDHVFDIPFTSELSELSARSFLES